MKKEDQDIYKKPIISINARNEFKLTPSFREIAKKQIGSNGYVSLVYSPRSKAIIFHFVMQSNYGFTYKLSDKSRYVVGATSFLNKYDLRDKHLAGRYTAVLKDIRHVGERWVIYLR